MSTSAHDVAHGDLSALPEQELGSFVLSQRWFGSKSKDITGMSVVEAIPLRTSDPPLILALIEARFDTGAHDLYQLPIGIRPRGDWEGVVVAPVNGSVVYDAIADGELVREIVRLIGDSADIATQQGVAEFRSQGMPELTVDDVRPIGGEQSNSSVVIDGQVVLKAYRRLGAGINPELELLSFLTAYGFEHIAPLRGWYAHSGGQLEATLGIVQDYIGDGEDGWDLALRCLAEDPTSFLGPARELGAVTGAMHAVLGSDASDHRFAPEDTSPEALGLLTATVDAEIDRTLTDLPDLPELAPLAGRAQEVREQLSLMTQVTATGKVIRHHGDYHLGQAMLAGGRWIVLDFEGEPARPLVERRRKRSPLRDVAGMLRSFAYAATASDLVHGKPAPAGWEQEVRAAFLDGYLAATDPALLPASTAATQRLIEIFEIEKAIYELRYELDHRPEWARIPAAAIIGMLEQEASE